MLIPMYTYTIAYIRNIYIYIHMCNSIPDFNVKLSANPNNTRLQASGAAKAALAATAPLRAPGTSASAGKYLGGASS